MNARQEVVTALPLELRNFALALSDRLDDGRKGSNLRNDGSPRNYFSHDGPGDPTKKIIEYISFERENYSNVSSRVFSGTETSSFCR